MCTSFGPSPAVSPRSFSHFFNAMSCVLPSCGVAIVLPRSCSGVVMSGLTTNWAPPAVAPEMSRTASPFDLANALIDGPEPMNVMSRTRPARR